MTAFAGNTNLLELTGLQAAIDEAYINDATVTVTVRTAAGVDVTGAVDLAMDYVAASDGDYRAVLPATLPLTAGARYVAVVDADGGTDRVGHWEFRFTAARRP